MNDDDYNEIEQNLESEQSLDISHLLHCELATDNSDNDDNDIPSDDDIDEETIEPRRLRPKRAKTVRSQ